MPMTASTIEFRITRDDVRLAHMAALALTLTLAEAAIPSPIPGVKPGLANIIVLLVLYVHGLRAAIWVSLLRVLAGSLLLGTFLTPTFVLSLTGACCSLLTLALLRHLPQSLFGPVSLSIPAAFSHIGGQLALAYFWLMPGSALLQLAPLFAAAALVFGLANGLIVAKLLAAQQPSAHVAPAAQT
jgi:heptaprenyl diphosphate synthase